MVSIKVLNDTLQQINAAAATKSRLDDLYRLVSIELYKLLRYVTNDEPLAFGLAAYPAPGKQAEKWYVAPAHEHNRLTTAARPLVERTLAERQTMRSTVGGSYGVMWSIPIEVHKRGVGIIVAALSNPPTDEQANQEIDNSLQLVSTLFSNVAQNYVDRQVFEVLKKASASLSSTAFTSEDDVLRQVRVHAVEVMKSMGNAHVFCHVARLKGDKLEFPPEVHDPSTRKKLKAKTNNEIDLKDGTNRIGIVGLAVRQRETINASDVHAQEFSQHYINLDPTIQSQLAVPIMLKGKVISVINVEHSEKAAFDDNAANAINALASAAGGAIQNVRLLNAVSLINKTVAEKSSMGLIFQRVLDQCLQLAICDTGSFALVDQRAAVIDTGYSNTIPFDLQPSQGVTAEVIKSKAAKYMEDVEEHAAYIRDNKNTKSELIVPVVSDETVLGIINLQSARTEDFSRDTRRIVQALADQSAVALRNLRLLTAMERLPNLAIEMGKTARITAHLGLKGLNATLARNLFAFYRYSAGSENAKKVKKINRIGGVSIVYADDGKGEGIVHVQTYIRDAAHSKHDSFSRSTLYDLFKSSHARLIEENDRELKWLPGYYSHIGVPVHTNDSDHFLIIHAERPYAFDVADRDILRNIATLYGDACMNVVRVNKLGKAVGAMSRINQKIAGYDFSSDPDEHNTVNGELSKLVVPGTIATDQGVYIVSHELWNLILSQACEISSAEFGALYANSSSQGGEAITAITRLGSWVHLPAFEFAPSDTLLLETIAQKVVQQKRAIRCSDSDPAGSLNIRDYVAVAIRQSRTDAEDCASDECEVLGVLIVASSKPTTFGPHDDKIVRTLAEQAAVALRYVDLREKLNTLIQQTHSITSEKLEKASGIILEQALSLLGQGPRQLRGTVSIVNLARNTLDLVAAIPPDERHKHDYSRIFIDERKQRSIIGTVARLGKRRFEPDTSLVADEVETSNVGSQIAVAIFGRHSKEKDKIQTAGKKKVVRAVLSVTSPRKNGLTRLDLEILTYYANLIGLLWLYASQSKRTDTLVRIASEWGEKRDWHELGLWKLITPAFHPICDTALGEYDLCGDEIAGTLATLEGKNLILQDKSNYVKPSYVTRNKKLKISRGVQGWVVRNAAKDPAIVAKIPDVEYPDAYLEAGDAQKEQLAKIYIHGINHDGQKTRSELAVPLFDKRPGAQKSVQGVLNIESPFVLAFDEADAEFLSALGNYAYAIQQYARDSQEDLRLLHMAVGTHEIFHLVRELRVMLEKEEPERATVNKWIEKIGYITEMVSAIDEAWKFEDRSTRESVVAMHGDRQEITGRELFEQAIEWVTTTRGEHNVKISYDEDPALDQPIRVFQVFKWVPKLLLDNAFNPAIRTTPNTHEIVLGAKVLPDQSSIELYIRDNGIGMSKAQRARLNKGEFESAERSQHDRRGLGWGLVLVYRIITAYHGGSWQVLGSGRGRSGVQIKVIMPTS